MNSKKAQSELITTVLIILLVLAAIIIVWQVVVGVLNQGKNQVESQSGCIGFSMTISNSSSTQINIIPNKDIQGFRIFVKGVEITNKLNDTSFVSGMSSASINTQQINSVVTTLAKDDEITAAGKIGSTWCDSINKAKA